MSTLSTVKIECPSCGQHYSLELGDEETEITCTKCDARFTASRIDDPSRIEESDGPGTEPIPSDRSAFKLPGPSFVDGFINLMFRFGKTFSGLLALVFLLGMLISAIVFVMNLRSTIEVPTYEDIVTEAASNTGSGSEGSSGLLDERRDIEKRFGDDLAALVKKHSLGVSTYDDLLSVIRQLEKDYRGDYVSGLEEVLGDAAESKDSKSPSLIEVVRNYSTAFARAEQKAIISKTGAKINRWSALGSILLCCVMLFMMLVIPALLKIEENTRRRDS